jgi:hypothetical protein
MPASLSSLLIALIALFPGLIGNRVFQILVGVDWREKEWRSLLRLLGFSVVGLAIYAIPAGVFGWPAPVHVFPATYQSASPAAKNLNYIFIPYAGHLVGGFLAGFLGAWGTILFARASSSSAYPGSWDDFARKRAPRHWVVVGLSNGDAYAGKLANVDFAVSSADRDLVLEEPCKFDPETDRYTALNYQYMFVSASSLFSIAAVYDPDIDRREVPVGESLFVGGQNVQERTRPAPAKGRIQDKHWLEAPDSAEPAAGPHASPATTPEESRIEEP